MIVPANFGRLLLLLVMTVPVWDNSLLANRQGTDRLDTSTLVAKNECHDPNSDCLVQRQDL